MWSLSSLESVWLYITHSLILSLINRYIVLSPKEKMSEYRRLVYYVLPALHKAKCKQSIIQPDQDRANELLKEIQEWQKVLKDTEFL